MFRIDEVSVTRELDVEVTVAEDSVIVSELVGVELARGCVGLEGTAGVVVIVAETMVEVPADKILATMFPSCEVRLRKKDAASGGISAIMLLSSASPRVPVGSGCPSRDVNAAKATGSVTSSRAIDVNSGCKEASREASADCTAAA